MAKPKAERNQAIWKDLQGGMSRREICQKYHLEIDGLKSLIRRIRINKGLLAEKVTSASTQTSASTSTKRMTFWLEEGMIEKIKSLARKQKRTASDIAREVFEGYLKK